MLSALHATLARAARRWHRSYVKRRHIAPLLATVPSDAVILEIGGGYNPRYVKATHPNVHHLDHASTEGLRAKFAADPTVAHRIDHIQPIDFVFDGRPIETLVPPDLRFDVIYGSHVLEHQTDLIGHLQSLELLLRPGGRVIEMIPDLRTCFDALRFPTVTADALAVHHQPPAVHRGKQLFEGMACELDKNLGYRMTDADFAGVGFTHDLAQVHAAMQAAWLPGAAYRDTHAWTFTPDSFRLLMIELRLLGLVRLSPSWMSPLYGNQFCAVLEQGPHGAELSAAQVRHLSQQRLSLARRLRVR